MLIMSYGAIVGKVPGEISSKEEELVMPWIMGELPMVKVATPVAVEQVPLQTPTLTVPPTTPLTPPGANGRFGSAVVGTVTVIVMCVASLTTIDRLESAVIVAGGPPEARPSLVASVGLLLATNPEPVRITVNVVPGLAVGKVAGEIPVITAAPEVTVTLMATTVVVAGVPQLNVTVPVSVCPGWAEENTDELKVTGMLVPKL
jgi:hypothetical protein